MNYNVQVTALDERTTNATALNQWVVASTSLNDLLITVIEVMPSVSAAVAYSSGEIGDVSTTIVVIVFSATINSPSSTYHAGVTIKVNAASVTISSSALQAGNTTVRFTLASAADINDEITFEYDSGPGDLEDSAASPLGSISQTTVINNIGTHWYFDTEEDSAHLAGE